MEQQIADKKIEMNERLRENTAEIREETGEDLEKLLQDMGKQADRVLAEVDKQFLEHENEWKEQHSTGLWIAIRIFHKPFLRKVAVAILQNR